MLLPAAIGKRSTLPWAQAVGSGRGCGRGSQHPELGEGRNYLMTAQLLHGDLLTDVPALCRFLGPGVELRYSRRRRDGHIQEP